MSNIVYKVVKVVPNPSLNPEGPFHFRSAVIDFEHWMLSYKIGIRTYPYRGYIYTFGTWEEAKRWAAWEFELVQCGVLTCEAGLYEGGPVSFMCEQYLVSEFEKWWKEPQWWSAYAPLGTVWCNWVEPFIAHVCLNGELKEVYSRRAGCLI